MANRIKIAIDVRDLQSAKTGTRTYLQEVCNAFKALDAADLEFYFFDSLLPAYSGHNKFLKLVEHARYQFWKQVCLPIRAAIKGCDIVFCTDNVVPLMKLGYQTIPVFHDAFFFESPENYGRLWLWLYKKTAIPAALRSVFVVTPSEWAKQQIAKYTGIADNKLIVIPEGPKTLDHQINSSVKGLAPQTYILHVGAWFKRKNLPALIRAFSLVKSTGNYPNLKLVLTGAPPSSANESDAEQIEATIAGSAFKADIVLTGYTPDEVLTSLYSNALMYVFPSTNEGFGIPVLEAFAHNLPVLVANNTCLPEVGGDAVLSFDPFNDDDIAKKIKTVVDDALLRQEMITKGAERLKQFSWHYTALQLADLFKKAV